MKGESFVESVRSARTAVAMLAAAILAAATVAATAAPSVQAAPAGASRKGSAAAGPGLDATALTATLRHRRKPLPGVSLTPSKTEPHWACPEGPCEAIVEPPAARVGEGAHQRFALPAGGPTLEGGGEDGGLDPQDLQSAYDIPTTGGKGQTIALIDAYGFEDAQQDLSTYRARYGLPPCTELHRCFRHVDERGGKARSKPGNPRGWEVESALDLEMASAACPECHILLVDAEGGSYKEYGEAVDTAVRLGATEISNSYGTDEEYCAALCEANAAAYDHPGVLVTASSGDSGYDNDESGDQSPTYPAVLPWVVAVGGTSLKRAANARGWAEEVWWEPKLGAGTGSGCAMIGEKPPWQADTGCARRTTNDVAAVAACETPVSMYVTSEGGWLDVCGTSVSSPLVAGIEAHASAYARSLPGADAFYHDPAALFDVTSGRNGRCTPPAEDEYLCTAGAGYDGPTGMGTPDGPLELTEAAPDARTNPVSEVTETSATLNGAIAPQGRATSYRFEYGPTAYYGASVPEPEGSAGSGKGIQDVGQSITGLEPGAVYHYRLVASSAAGTSYSHDESFETAAVPSVSEISPSNSPSEGQVAVTISGAGFDDVTAVTFGSHRASFTVDSKSSITAIAPPGLGTVDVTVTTPMATSATSPADRFEYVLGPVLAWGRDDGMLGRGFPSRLADVPVEMYEAPEAVSLAAGSAQSFAALRDGEVLAVGSNANGDLGDGSSRGYSAMPVTVCAPEAGECPQGPYLQEASAVAAGDRFSLALLDDGTVVGWGDGGHDSLGGAAALDNPTPVHVCTAVETPCSPEHYLREVIQIAAGQWTSYALLGDGTVEAWGRGVEGELGNGESGTRISSKVPLPVSGLSEVSAIAAGTYDALALLRNGTVMAWGWNEYANLGDGELSELSAVPVPVCSGVGSSPCAKPLGEVSAIAAGQDDGYALMRDGTVRAWGWNSWGQLGDGTTRGPQTCHLSEEKFACSKTPVQVKGLSEVSALATGVGLTDTLALLKNGDLMTWGLNEHGELGDGNLYLADSDLPVHVCAAYATEPCPNGPYLSGEVIAMAAGGEHDLVSFAAGP